MYTFGERLKSLRKEAKLTQDGLVKQINNTFALNINKGMLSKWESNKVEPRLNIVKALALFFHVKSDFLLGLDEIPIAEKNVQNVQSELQKIIEGLSSASYSVFDNQDKVELDNEDKELLIASLENSLRLANRIAKQKFTSHKIE